MLHPSYVLWSSVFIVFILVSCIFSVFIIYKWNVQNINCLFSYLWMVKNCPSVSDQKITIMFILWNHLRFVWEICSRGGNGTDDEISFQAFSPLRNNSAWDQTICYQMVDHLFLISLNFVVCLFFTFLFVFDPIVGAWKLNVPLVFLLMCVTHNSFFYLWKHLLVSQLKEVLELWVRQVFTLCNQYPLMCSKID